MSGERGVNTGQFFLTFDGAPNSEGTPAILDALEDLKIEATFFLEGWRVEREPELARDILRCGHLVGNHSYAHPDNFDEWSPEAAVEEFKKADRIIRDVLGVQARLIRPPGGLMPEGFSEQIRNEEWNIVLWSYSIRDWEGPDGRAVSERILKRARTGSIVVLHDHVPWSPDVVRAVVPELSRLNMACERLDLITDWRLLPAKLPV